MSYYDCDCLTEECDCATRHIKRLEAQILELEGENEKLTQRLEYTLEIMDRLDQDYDRIEAELADRNLQLSRVSRNGGASENLTDSRTGKL